MSELPPPPDMRLVNEPRERHPFKALGWGTVELIGLALEHWFITLLIVGAIIATISAIIPNESDHPRPGYEDTGRSGTAQECQDQGGDVVGDVCYLP